jgi:hypothetical protein
LIDKRTVNVVEKNVLQSGQLEGSKGIAIRTGRDNRMGRFMISKPGNKVGLKGQIYGM